ncbi:MAG: hypothetical protein MI810_16945 [Flavobacteriales bacterium]|nr:hypothetical protein [Flavobacteriales bacterium]
MKLKKKFSTVFISLLLLSCGKDVTICVDGDLNPAEPGSYTYNWCGENADEVQWTTGDGNTYLGNSITLDFHQKGTHYLNVYAENKRKNSSEQLEINVGTREARVELYDCAGNTQNYPHFRAYVYNNRSELQTDLRNGNFNGCIDSITLESSYYYNNTNDHSVQTAVGGFKGLGNGQHLIYVREYDHISSANLHRNNLLPILNNGDLTNINIDNGAAFDQILMVNINNQLYSEENAFIQNFLSKTFVLTDVTLNDVAIGVSDCNTDDKMIFNLDGSWEHNVGDNDCSGGQTNSAGTYYGWANCTTSLNSTSLGLIVNSGSFLDASSVTLTYVSSNQFNLHMTVGANYMVQQYTAF